MVATGVGRGEGNGQDGEEVQTTRYKISKTDGCNAGVPQPLGSNA